MKIETKLNVGDEAFYMGQRKVCAAEVEKIIVTVEEMGRGPNEQKILYALHGMPTTLEESEVFATKQELLASL